MQQIVFQLIAVFTGAICGALFRYKLADRFDNKDFYYGTFTANTAACAVLAFSLMISIRDLDLSCLCAATLAGTMSTYASFAYQIAKDLQNRLFKKAFIYATATLFTSLFVYFLVVVLITLAKNLLP